MATLANAWAANGHEITVITVADAPVFYPLSKRVVVHSLGLAGKSPTFGTAVLANTRRAFRLRTQLLAARPDVFISFMDCSNVLAVLASMGTGVPTIICEHTDPAQNRIKPLWSIFRFLTYPLADAATFLTANVFRRWKWLGNALVMPNPVVAEKAISATTPRWVNNARRLLAVGRLHTVKGYDRLLPAFAQATKQHPEWTLTILGEGPERSRLEKQIFDLGLVGRVNMPGNVSNPFDWMSEADFLVLSSRYEGFPCVVGEALACGLPVVSFDCDSGPRDIIRDGIDGLLVEPDNVEALAASIAHLMGNEAQRVEMARRAPEVLARFSLDAVLQQWDRLFAKVTA